MSFINYFKPVNTITASKVKEMIKGKSPDEFCLLDVRQPKEYEQGHIPGAILIPIAQLPERLNELNPDIPIIAYCAIGGRSRAAASILQDAGFSEPYNLKGGFNVWNGQSAVGPPETGMAYFSDVIQPQDILALAWILEEGTRLFYEEMSKNSEDQKAKEVYENLKKIEKTHQLSIENLYTKIIGVKPDPSFPYQSHPVSDDEKEELIEGQMKLTEVFNWARDRSLLDVLEFSMSLEAKLYDLYFRMKQKYKELLINQVYSSLAAEEKQHMEFLAGLIEERI